MGTKENLSTVTDEVEALKKILENTTEIAELLEKHPGLVFQYPVLFISKNIRAGIIAEKITKIALPELTKMLALKIAERHKLEKQIKESK